VVSEEIMTFLSAFRLSAIHYVKMRQKKKKMKNNLELKKTHLKY
jgi:hypothetical protein